MQVSIIMPMRNAHETVRDAVDSILAQTHQQWELLIIDDRSDDDSAAIVAAYEDTRIRLLRPEGRMHFAGALNHGSGAATGDLVARMDADDVSLPERLAQQVAFMDANPDVALCGTWARTFGLGKPSQLRPPVSHSAIQAAVYFDCPFVHPSVMWRSAALDPDSMRYDGSFCPAEDYELWDRLVPQVRCANIPAVLLSYRVRAGSMTTGDGWEMDTQATRIHQRQLERLGLRPTGDDALWHRRVGRGPGYRCKTREEFDVATTHLCRLTTVRKNVSGKAGPAFDQQLADAWYRLCFHNLALGRDILTAYNNSRIAPQVETSRGRRLALAAAFVKHATVGAAAPAVSPE